MPTFPIFDIYQTIEQLEKLDQLDDKDKSDNFLKNWLKTLRNSLQSNLSYDPSTGPFGLTFLSTEGIEFIESANEIYENQYLQGIKISSTQKETDAAKSEKDPVKKKQLATELNEKWNMIESELKVEYEQISRKFQAEAFWKEIEKSGTIDTQNIKALHDKWKKHDKFAHLSSQNLLNLTLILDEIELYHRNAVSALTRTQTYTQFGPSYVHPLFSEQCFNYLNFLHETIKRERRIIAESMLARLSLASESSNLKNDDILWDIAKKIKLHRLPEKPKCELTSELFEFFHAYIYQYGNKEDLNSLAWFNPQEATGLIHFTIRRGDRNIIEVLPKSNKTNDKMIFSNYKSLHIFEISEFNLSIIVLNTAPKITDNLSSTLDKINIFLEIFFTFLENNQSNESLYKIWLEMWNLCLQKLLEFYLRITNAFNEDVKKFIDENHNHLDVPSALLKQIIHFKNTISTYYLQICDKPIKRLIHKISEQINQANSKLIEYLFEIIINKFHTNNNKLSAENVITILINTCYENEKPLKLIGSILLGKMLDPSLRIPLTVDSLKKGISDLNYKKNLSKWVYTLITIAIVSIEDPECPLLALLKDHDQTYKTTYEKEWIKKRQDKLHSKLSNLIRWLKLFKEKDHKKIIENQQNAFEDLKAIQAFSKIIPNILLLLYKEIQNILRDYQGEHNYLANILLQLEDKVFLYDYAQKRFNYFISKNELVQLANEDSLLRMIGRDENLRKYLSKIFLVFLTSDTSELLFNPIITTMIGDFLTSDDTESFYLYLDSFYLQELNQVLDKNKIDTESVNKIVYSIKLNFPQFPYTSTSRINLKTRFELAIEQENWNIVQHKLLSNFSEQFPTFIQQYRLKWLYFLLTDREFANDYYYIHESQAGGFNQLATFYGLEQMEKVIAYMDEFIEKDPVNPDAFKLVNTYLVEDDAGDVDYKLFINFNELIKKFHNRLEFQEILKLIIAQLKAGDFISAAENLNNTYMSKELNSLNVAEHIIERDLKLLEEDIKNFIINLMADENKTTHEIQKCMLTFKKEFFDAILFDKTFKSKITYLIDNSCEICVLNINIISVLGEHYYNNKDWLLAFEENDIQRILYGFTAQNKLALTQLLNQWNLQNFHPHAKQAVYIFKKLLTNQSCDPNKDITTLHRFIKLSRYRESWLMLHTDGEAKQQLLTQIQTENSGKAEDIAFVINELQNNTVPCPTVNIQKQKNWQDMLFTMLLGNPSQAEGLDCIISTTLGTRRLNPDVFKQIFNEQGDFVNERINKEDRHYVLKVNLGNHFVHCKFLPDSPGIEFASGCFERLLFGYSSPETELLRFPKNTGGYNQPYPVLISKHIDGMLLSESELWNTRSVCRLDSKNYAQNFLRAYLLREQDGKARNYITQPANENNTDYNLVCIEKEQGLGPHYLKKGILNGYKIERLTSSVIFCFDDIFTPFDKHVANHITSVDAHKLLEEWILEIKHKNERYLQLFDRELIDYWYEREEDKVVIPIPLREKFVMELYQEIVFIQEVLRSNPSVTYWDLLLTINPTLASFYEKPLKESLSPAERFNEVCRNSYRVVSNSTTKKETFITTSSGYIEKVESLVKGKEPTPEQVLDTLKFIIKQCNELNLARMKLEQGDLKPFKQLILSDFKEKVLNGIPHLLPKINWRVIPEPVQYAVLAAMAGNSFRTLYLAHCKALDSNLLLILLKSSPHLLKLDISYCTKLNEQDIRNIVEYCSHIETLCANGLSIKSFSNHNFILGHPPLRMFALKNLYMSSCEQLTLIHLIAPQLMQFNAANCRLLSDLKVFSKQIVNSNLANCNALEKRNIFEKLLPASWSEPKLTRLFDKILSHKILHLVLSGENIIEQLLIKATHFTKSLLYFEYTSENFNETFINRLIYALNTNRSLITIKLKNICFNTKLIKLFSAMLSNNKNLKIIHLINCNIDDQKLYFLAEALKINKVVTILDLSNNLITSQGVKQFTEAIFVNGNLRSINLSGNKIKSEGAKVIAAEINKLPLLQLNVDNNDIDDEGIISLAQALKYNTQLRSLRLANNNFQLQAVISIAEMLAFNSVLTQLVLDTNKIGDNVQYIARKLTLNSSLTVLSINDNEITNSGAQELSYLLKNNSILNFLLLNSNNISGDGAKALSEAICSSALLGLDVSENNIDDEGIKCLAQAIEKNTTLLTLRINKNYIGNNANLALANMIRNNSTLLELDVLNTDANFELFKAARKNNKLLFLTTDKIWKDISFNFGHENAGTYLRNHDISKIPAIQIDELEAYFSLHPSFVAISPNYPILFHLADTFYMIFIAQTNLEINISNINVKFLPKFNQNLLNSHKIQYAHFLHIISALFRQMIFYLSYCESAENTWIFKSLGRFLLDEKNGFSIVEFTNNSTFTFFKDKPNINVAENTPEPSDVEIIENNNNNNTN